MTKAQLIKWSAARDMLDLFIIGQIPPFNWLLDIPLFIMHFAYAGPMALVGLLELIPVVGMFPFFSTLAALYPKQEEAPAAEPTNVAPVSPATAPQGRVVYVVVK